MQDRKEPTWADTNAAHPQPDVHQRVVYYPVERRLTYFGLVWKIALGAFIGLSLFLFATCSIFVVGTKQLAQEQARQQRAALNELQRVADDPDPLGLQRELDRQKRAEAAAKALGPGERCIQGKRFRRVENGWVQVERPC